MPWRGKHGFQILDRPRQQRLLDVLSLRRAREVDLFGDSLHDEQLVLH